MHILIDLHSDFKGLSCKRGKFKEKQLNYFDWLAQLVEQRPFKAWVLGSSPRPVTLQTQSNALGFFISALWGEKFISIRGIEVSHREGPYPRPAPYYPWPVPWPVKMDMLTKLSGLLGDRPKRLWVRSSNPKTPFIRSQMYTSNFRTKSRFFVQLTGQTLFFSVLSAHVVWRYT